MPSTTAIAPGIGIEARSQRIADFLRRQAHLAHLLVVWHGGREIVFQALPDPDVAFEILRESVKRGQLAPKLGRTNTSPVPDRFRRLDTQLEACIRGLQRTGTEFVFCFKIGDQAARIEHNAHRSWHSVKTDLVTLLEQAKRSNRKCAGVVADWM